MFSFMYTFSRKCTQSELIVLLGILTCLFLSGCKSNTETDVYNLPAITAKELVNAVIEIPAGTNKKIEFDTTTKQFVIDQRNGKDRVINYLPYPANYGFIPGTYSDPNKGGDGDALDILVIAESLPSAKVIEVLPIGMFKLLDEGELDYKIIAIPSNPTLQIVKAHTLEALLKDYPNITTIIENWFMNYDVGNSQESLGWGNEVEAMEEITSQLKME